MSDSLAALWDGERHLLESGEHFPTTGARLIIESWEQDEEEDILSPFESPSRTPMLLETGEQDEEYWAKFPMKGTEQAWGALSMSLTALSTILGVGKKQYQETNYETKKTLWSFQSAEFITERL